MKKNVLLVDDEYAFNVYNKDILNDIDQIGTIETATNGSTALLLLEEKISRREPLPEVILLDINMPVMTGFEFMEELIAHPALDQKKFQISILSCSLDPEDRKRALKFGIENFFEKPLDPLTAIKIVTRN